jgi:regulator of ribonuclease activity A
MAALATADLCDRDDPTVQVCDPVFRDFGGRRQFSGPLATVKCFEDNSRVREVLGEAGGGRVLAVDAGGSLRCAVLGDRLAEAAVANGWAGIIVFGCVRDRARLAALDLGVKALAATPRRGVRRGEGQAGLPVRFAGVSFEPGAHVYCDLDGILVSPGPLELE